MRRITKADQNKLIELAKGARKAETAFKELNPKKQREFFQMAAHEANVKVKQILDTLIKYDEK